LQHIKERSNEVRPKPQTLTSYQGVDDETKNTGMEECLLNPPTETRPETRPQATKDDRYSETEAISNTVQEKKDPFTDAIKSRGPNLKVGESKRQASHAEAINKSQSEDRSDTRNTLLLVEDNLINQKVLRRQLQSKGFEVRYSCLHLHPQSRRLVPVSS
jgi:hypothetical protein